MLISRRQHSLRRQSTLPFQALLHSQCTRREFSLHRLLIEYSLYAFGEVSANCAWHKLPTHLTTNTFIWTPVPSGRRPTPEVEGNETDYRIIITDGDSLYVSSQSKTEAN